MPRKPAPTLSRFECTYHPCSRAGAPIPNESGALPCVIVDAADAEAAKAIAHKQVGFPIVEATRIAEDIKPPRKPRARKQPAPDLRALGLTTGAALLAALQTEETTS